MYVELSKQLNTRQRDAWQALLRKVGLEPDEAVTQTALLWDDDVLVAVGSREENLLKCIAVDESYQGEDCTSAIVSALRQAAFSEGHRHLFLYTKPQNERLFSSLFFYPVAKTDAVLLMENRQNGITDFLEGLPSPYGSGTVGAIVMNGNPFTRGHRHLIETAARECEGVYVFVVSENKSRFSFDDRLQMARLGTADLTNVTVLPTGPYLVSSATFPTYFLKDRDRAGAVHCRLDIEIFMEYFVPKFSIDRRYVGTEPLSPMTKQYNEELRRALPTRGVELREIPRLEWRNAPISASAVRAALAEDNAEQVAALVPASTLLYIAANES